VLVPTRQRGPEIRMLFLATLLLAIGIMVYALDRAGAVYFLPDWTAAPTGTAIFGPLGDHLPTFLHPLVFILITAAVFRPWLRLLPAICATWFAIYFTRGTYDPLDILSIGLGTVIAYPIVRAFLRGE